MYAHSVSRPAILEHTTAEDVPEVAPRDVTVVANSSTSLLVQWLPPLPFYSNGVIQQYLVTVIDVAAGSNTVVSASGSNFSVVVGGLWPNRNYSIAVAAATTLGVGPLSGALAVVTFEDAPSVAPGNFTAIVVESERYDSLLLCSCARRWACSTIMPSHDGAPGCTLSCSPLTLCYILRCAICSSESSCRGCR